LKIQVEPLKVTNTVLLVFSGCHMIAMTSVILNPFMYGWLNGNFKQVLKLCEVCRLVTNQEYIQGIHSLFSTIANKMSFSRETNTNVVEEQKQMKTTFL
jgi:hypothetical protein